MPLHIVVGEQWVDEGKSWIVDWLAACANLMLHYNGG